MLQPRRESLSNVEEIKIKKFKATKMIKVKSKKPKKKNVLHDFPRGFRERGVHATAVECFSEIVVSTVDNIGLSF